LEVADQNSLLVDGQKSELAQFAGSNTIS